MPTRAKLQLRPSKTAPLEQRPQQAAGKPRSRQNTKLIGGHFPRSTWAAVHQLGIELDKTVQELLQEALDDLLAKHRRL
jgi:hypothetical protein